MRLSRRWLTAVLSAAGSLPARAMPPAAVPDQTTLPPKTPVAVISIVATVPTAYAAAGVPGSFVLRRKGDPLPALTVAYQVSGQAVAGQDYKALKGTKTIAPGKTQVLITIHPYPVAGSSGTVKGVRVTLLAGDEYAVGKKAKATVRIVQ